MSSFFTGRMPDWGSAATGGSAMGGSSADQIARMREHRARGAFMNEIRGVGSMGDYENTGDWWRSMSQAGAAALRAYHDAGGTGGPAPAAPFVDRATSLGIKNAQRSALQGSITQSPKLGSPQSGNSSDVRAIIAKRFARRMPAVRVT
jgi:hypothetical protein